MAGYAFLHVERFIAQALGDTASVRVNCIIEQLAATGYPAVICLTPRLLVALFHLARPSMLHSGMAIPEA